MQGLKYMPRKRIDNRMIRRSRSARSLRRFTIVFLLSCSLVLGMIFSGWVKWKQREFVYRTNQLQSHKEALLENRKRLVKELSRLQTPERIARLARISLGMDEAARERIIFVTDAEDQMAVRNIGSPDPVAGGKAVGQ